MQRWYVVQVLSGQEDAVLSAVWKHMAEARVGKGVLRECFCLRYMTQQKIRGRWREVSRKLMPGYLIAVSDDVSALDRHLHAIEPFARILRNEEGFIPLDAEEVSWIDAFTDEGKRLVPMSSAVKEGDRVMITDGPLREQASRIVKIDRRKSVAYVKINFLGRVKSVPIGLKVLAKLPDE